MKFFIHRTAAGNVEWELIGKSRVLCRSAIHFETEAAARSDIAEVKTAMAGVRFAKVEKGS